MGGGGVARGAVVDHDDATTLAGELQRGGETGGRTTDHGDVAVPFHRGVLGVTRVLRVG
ncbi:hypothetical protein GCM10017776_10720 [Streptomyces griseoluteus]|nr:hypothetical protein GCM10017776_10720 [Streptomyces griseoluteus]